MWRHTFFQNWYLPELLIDDDELFIDKYSFKQCTFFAIKFTDEFTYVLLSHRRLQQDWPLVILDVLFSV